MTPSFFGAIVLRDSDPDDAGFWAPSAAHPAVSLPVTTGMLTPDGPSGTSRASCITTDCWAARSKMGWAISRVINPEKEPVVVAAVTAMGCVLLLGRGSATRCRGLT